MIKARLGADLDAALLRLFPAVGRLPVHPDVLTLAGVAVAAAAGVAFALGRVHWGGVLLLLAGGFDLFDGVVARAQGRASRAGAFFDSTMDRVSDLLVLAGIGVGFAAAGDVLGVGLLFWALIGSVVTPYARARAEVELARLDAGVLERGERWLLLILGGLTGWLRLALAAVAVGASVSAVQRVVAARRALRVLDATGRDPTAQEALPGAAGLDAGRDATN